jgi:anti-sigma B factor antagonist
VFAEPTPPARRPTREALDPPLDFSLSRRRVAGGTYVALSGELDLGTVPLADPELRQAQREARHVLLDLRALTFIDACGLNMILAAARRARRTGARMVVLHGSSCVSRILELTGAERALETTTDAAACDGARPYGPPARFQCDIVDEVDRVRIAPVGELDMASSA